MKLIYIVQERKKGKLYGTFFNVNNALACAMYNKDPNDIKLIVDIIECPINKKRN